VKRHTKRNSLIPRIAFAVSEARASHGLSESQLAALAGVSRGTVHKLERTGRIRPDLAVRIAAAVTVCDLYAQPAPEPLDDALAARLAPSVDALAGGWSV
jgi:DNA-binding XRE family transcriptional regulator